MIETDLPPLDFYTGPVIQRFLTDPLTGVQVPYIRPPGLHLSGIIKYIDNKYINKGKRKPHLNVTIAEKKRMGGYIELGFLWEVLFEAAWKQRWLDSGGLGKPNFITQPAAQLDGIWMTPDAFDFNTWTLFEFKVTWRSLRRFLNHPITHDFLPWYIQILGYLQYFKANHCELHAYFTCGDYRDSGPLPMARMLEVSDAERQRNWDMILRTRDDMKRKGVLKQYMEH